MASQKTAQKLSSTISSRPVFKKGFKFECFSLHGRAKTVDCAQRELEVLGVKARASLCVYVALFILNLLPVNCLWMKILCPKGNGDKKSGNDASNVL